MHGGRLHWASLILELLGIMLLLVSLWNPRYVFSVLSRLTLTFLLANILLTIAYLIPLPLSLWQLLPGHQVYSATLELINQMGSLTNSSYPLSLIPYRTVSFILESLPILGIFLATSLLPKQSLVRLTYILLGIAVAQAILGILQTNIDWIYRPYLPGRPPTVSAQGTHSNYNNFAAMLAMSIPISIALTLNNIHKSFKQTMLFLILALLLSLTILISLSRAGIVLTFLGIASSLILLIRGIRYKMLSAAIFLTLPFLAIFKDNLFPSIARFQTLDPSTDPRWSFYAKAWEGIVQFFPFGSGPGTFQAVFLGFHPNLYGKLFVNHAHNEYLELLFEMGLAGVILIILGMAVYISGWLAIRKRTADDNFRSLQIAAGVSITLVLLHNLVDFQFHVPANAIFFAFFAAIFLHRPDKKKECEETSTDATSR